MTHEDVTDEELAELIQRTTEAAKAYIRGDMRTYFTLIKHTEDNTLMSPFGGEPTRGVVHFRRSRRVGGDRTSAWPRRWPARTGLVAPGDLGLSP
jgi:hypothetical protein